MPGHTHMIVCIDCKEYKWNQSATRCAKCYQIFRIRTEEPKPCSRCDKSHVMIKKGLCPTCYKQDWNDENRDRVNKYNRVWNDKNPERKRATDRRYGRSEKGQAHYQARNHIRLQILANAPGNGLSRKEWEDIKEEHNHSCYYCGKKPKRLEIEHKIPISRGGAHDPINIVPSCMKCNRDKGTLTEKEFAQKRAG